MEPFSAILFMVSCDPAMVVCREEPAPTAVYETVDQCQVAKTIVKRHIERDGKVTVGRCVGVDAEALETDAAIVWYIDSVGGLIVDVVIDAPAEDPQLVSSGDTIT